MSKPPATDMLPNSSENKIDYYFGKSGPFSRLFPNYEERMPQIDMAKRVMEALIRDEKIMVEAGTGTGKTFAYLIPALLSGKKVVLSTGTKTLQDQIFFKDLPFLQGILPHPLRYSFFFPKRCW